MALFQKGQPKIGGRAKGVYNRISHAFLEALLDDIAARGIEAIRITRVERPAEYCKIVASLLPKEFEFSDNRLTEITDDELIAYLEYAQRELAERSRGIEERTEPKTH